MKSNKIDQNRNLRVYECVLFFFCVWLGLHSFYEYSDNKWKFQRKNRKSKDMNAWLWIMTFKMQHGLHNVFMQLFFSRFLFDIKIVWKHKYLSNFWYIISYFEIAYSVHHNIRITHLFVFQYLDLINIPYIRQKK